MSHMWTWKYDPFDTTEYGEDHLHEEIKKNWIYHKAKIDEIIEGLVENMKRREMED